MVARPEAEAEAGAAAVVVMGAEGAGVKGGGTGPWEKLGAVVIEQVDDFEAIRRGISVAVAGVQGDQ